MSQTYGSQAFGSVYDVVVPTIMAVAFISLACEHDA